MSTGESKRPSLTSRTDPGPAPKGVGAKAAPSRILADMEQRTPSRTPRRVSPILLGCLLGSALLLGGYLLFANSSTSGAPIDEHSTPMTSVDTQPQRDVPLPDASDDAALIVDDIGVQGTPDMPSRTNETTVAGAQAAAPGAADHAKSATDPGESPLAAVSTRSSAPEPRARSRAKTSGPVARAHQSRHREPDLLSTLMANIGQTSASPLVADASAPRSTTGGQSAIDELVAQIRNNRDENYTESATALGKIGATSGSENTQAASAVVQTSKSVQSELRECPKANSVAGIECRRRVCARYSRQDAACP